MADSYVPLDSLPRSFARFFKPNFELNVRENKIIHDFVSSSTFQDWARARLEYANTQILSKGDLKDCTLINGEQGRCEGKEDSSGKRGTCSGPGTLLSDLQWDRFIDAPLYEFVGKEMRLISRPRDIVMPILYDKIPEVWASSKSFRAHHGLTVSSVVDERSVRSDALTNNRHNMRASKIEMERNLPRRIPRALCIYCGENDDHLTTFARLHAVYNFVFLISIIVSIALVLALCPSAVPKLLPARPPFDIWKPSPTFDTPMPSLALKTSSSSQENRYFELLNSAVQKWATFVLEEEGEEGMKEVLESSRGNSESTCQVPRFSETVVTTAMSCSSPFSPVETCKAKDFEVSLVAALEMPETRPTTGISQGLKVESVQITMPAPPMTSSPSMLAPSRTHT